MTLKKKKIDDRLIRKGASHENPVPFDRSLGTPRENPRGLGRTGNH